MDRILIIGAGGQLGRELSELYPESIKLYHGNSGEFQVDAVNMGELERKIISIDPDLLINASALANVDRCEREKGYAYKVNGLSVGTMASCSRSLGIPFVHVSTDYIFDGNEGNYSECDFPNPINYYGLSKLVGDVFADSYENSLIVRTSGVFGHTSNFPRFVYNTLSEGKTVNAIPGYYSPIHARNLAAAIRDLVSLGQRGIINVAGERISRNDLAIQIAEFFDLPKDLIREPGEVKTMVARRPFDSSLNIEKAKSLLNTDFYSVKSNLEQFRKTVDK
ncbi:dTDP-4-dehydrorhamnose reductase [Thermoplasmatales archaeon]|nr:dTDP-4-dehydrorhamnose reductase [Thermoplasmatales archaeon]